MPHDSTSLSTRSLNSPATELDRLKAQLDATESFHEIAVTHLGLDGRWLMVPDHFCRLLGYTCEELVGRPIWDFTHPDDIDRERELNERLLRRDVNSVELEKRYRTREGRVVWMALNRCLVCAPDGTPLQFLSIHRDITARRDAESEQAVLSGLAMELSAADRLEAAALAARRATESLWSWDTFQISVRPSGHGDFRVILRVDRSGGRDQVEFWGTHGTRLDEALGSGPLLINRTPGSGPVPEPVLEHSGESPSPSASLLFAPIRNRGELTGILSIQSRTPGFFGDHDAARLQRVAETLAPAFERIRAEMTTRERDRLYREAITCAGAVPYQYNHVTDRYDFIGDAIREITGFPAEEFTPALWRTLVQQTQTRGEGQNMSLAKALREARQGTIRWLADVRIGTRTGETRWVSDSAVPLFDDQGFAWGSLGILQDITDRKLAEEEAIRRDIQDSLTGVASRTLLVNHLEQAISRARRRSHYRFAVVFLGLDRFGLINESFGHEVGDMVLRTVARRLEKALRQGDLVARFSGDEFVLFLDDLREPDDVKKVIGKVTAELEVPVEADGHQLTVSACSGIVASSPNYHHAGDMLRDAGNALRRAKSRGRGRSEFFDTAMHRSVIASLEMENDLRRALDDGEFHLFYQPILSLATGRIMALEALLRWKHPQRGWISPAEFIPVAEESDLIVPIGTWVLNRAAVQLANWRRMFPSSPELSVSINLSARQFVPGDLPSRALLATEQAGIDPASLTLEITESILMQNREHILQQLQELKKANFSLHLDDFGTGYSSLAYLHSFPIDALKIDRSFVARIGAGGREQEIVRSIVALAQSLKMAITAEGVEKPEQLQVLQGLGCTAAQGYLFSRPLPADEMTGLLLKHGQG